MNRSYSKIRHIQESNQRLENRLLNEKSMEGTHASKIGTDPNSDPIQKPFYEYVLSRWGHDEDPYASVDIERDQNGNLKVCDGPCKAMIPGTDENTIIWDYKRGVVLGLKSFGIDPKPISIKSNLSQMRQWFDNTYGYDPRKSTTSGGHPDGL